MSSVVYFFTNIVFRGAHMKLRRDSSDLPLSPLFDIDLHRDLVADREFQTVYANAPDFVRELLLVDYFET